MLENEHLRTIPNIGGDDVETKDLIVIGGGINGAGIAVDAA